MVETKNKDLEKKKIPRLVSARTGRTGNANNNSSDLSGWQQGEPFLSYQGKIAGSGLSEN